MNALAPLAAGPQGLTRSERHVLGMAELGIAGLSEQWLLRRLGDAHWRMIAQLTGAADTRFRDADGAPVYAAFRALSIEMEAGPGEGCDALGAELAIWSQLGSLAPTRLVSRHRLAVGRRFLGQVTMVSVFVGTGEGGNRGLRRAVPRGLVAGPTEPAPEFLARLGDYGAGRATGHLGIVAGRPVGQTRARPAPDDFNAAGLLYFPSFIRLADRVAWDHGLSGGARAPYRRDVLYRGNIDPGEAVEISVGARWSRITREDGALLCAIFTR